MVDIGGKLETMGLKPAQPIDRLFFRGASEETQYLMTGKMTDFRNTGGVPNRPHDAGGTEPPEGALVRMTSGGNEQTKFFISPVLTGSEPLKTGEMKN